VSGEKTLQGHFKLSNIEVLITSANPIVLKRLGKLWIWELRTRVFEDKEERYPLS